MRTRHITGMVTQPDSQADGPTPVCITCFAYAGTFGPCRLPVPPRGRTAEQAAARALYAGLVEQAAAYSTTELDDMHHFLLTLLPPGDGLTALESSPRYVGMSPVLHPAARALRLLDPETFPTA